MEDFESMHLNKTQEMSLFDTRWEARAVRVEDILMSQPQIIEALEWNVFFSLDALNKNKKMADSPISRVGRRNFL